MDIGHPSDTIDVDCAQWTFIGHNGYNGHIDTMDAPIVFVHMGRSLETMDVHCTSEYK